MLKLILRPTLALVGLSLVAASFAAPAILIVPLKPQKYDTADPEGNVLEMLAGSLDADGRVAPIAWSMTDPIFRAARDSGKIPGTAFPTQEQAMEAANLLRCDYVIFLSVFSVEKTVYAKARLMHKGREIWVDPKPDPRMMEIIRSGAKIDPKGKPLDMDQLTSKVLMISLESRVGLFDTFKTLAQTWSDLMAGDPLKNLKARPRTDGQVPVEGNVVKVPDPTPPPKLDNTELLKKVMAMLAKGETASAITLMRDAVDTAPLDLERRKVLVEVLMSAGYYEESARQARRAASIIENPATMFVAAAKAWLAADKLDEAQADLKEAVTREPESPLVRSLMGQVSLKAGDYEGAERHLSASLEKGDEPEALFFRSLTYALIGEGGKARADLEKAKSLGFGSASLTQKSLYGPTVNVVSTAGYKCGGDLRDLIQKVKLKPYDKSHTEALDALRVRSDSLQLFLKELPPPDKHVTSHGERSLAIKFIVEAVALTESFLKDGDEDVLSDALISLGEGLRRMTVSRESFAKEIAG